MNDSFSKKLLLAIVHSLRNTFGNSITSDNFIVISGFLSCDIDGKTQHRFVINELISSEGSGEGHSSCLKVIDWNYLSKKLSSPRNDKSCKQGNSNQLPVAINHKVRICRGGQTKSRCVRAATKMRQKCVNGPIGHCQFTGSRNKRSNQTFTLEDIEIPTCSQNRECNLIRNFSSATISIASQQTIPEHQTSPEMNSEQTSSTLSCSRKVSSSASRSVSRSARSLCEDYSHRRSGEDSSFLNNTKSDTVSQKNSCSQSKAIKSCVSAEVRKLSKKKHLSGKGNSSSERSLKSGRETSRAQNMTNLSTRKKTHVFEKSRYSLNGGDSEISIDSIRPRYLVQHNDELLLPCPNLSSKYSKHLATTKNNNRTFSRHLPNQSCEESVSNSSHLSNLLSSIIGALSYSNLVNIHDASKNLQLVSQGFSGGKLTGNDNKDGSSNDSLKSVSSLETDSFESTLSSTSDTVSKRARVRTKLVYCGRNTGNKHNGTSSSSAMKSQFLL